MARLLLIASLFALGACSAPIDPANSTVIIVAEEDSGTTRAETSDADDGATNTSNGVNDDMTSVPADCLEGFRSTPDGCEPVPYLRVYASHRQERDGAPAETVVTACYFGLSGLEMTERPVAAETDDCVVFDGFSPAAHEIAHGDFGVVSISGGTSPISLDTEGPESYPCWGLAESPQGLLFDGGDRLAVTVPGGADTAPTEFSAEIPDLVEMRVEEFDPGDDVAVRWTPGDPADEFFITVSCAAEDGSYVNIWCTPPDNGSFTVEGALTSMLPANPQHCRVDMVRRDQVVVEAGDNLVVGSLESSANLSFLR